MFDQPVPASFQVSHTELEEHLRSYGVTDCYVTGIATDICVNATAMHSMEIGFRTVLVNDACRYILSTPKWLVRCLVKLFPAKKCSTWSCLGPALLCFAVHFGAPRRPLHDIIHAGGSKRRRSSGPASRSERGRGSWWRAAR